jgi:hypothetical protein
MTSLVYTDALNAGARGDIDYEVDTFKCVLLTASYVPDKNHRRRSDLTSMHGASGTYPVDGVVVLVTVSKDEANDRVDIGLGALQVTSASITARYGVYYKARGGSASQDELIACVDFGEDVISTMSTWQLTASTMRMQN